MTAFILSILGSDLGKAALAAVAGLLGLIGLRMKSVADGRAKERAAQAERDLKTERDISDAKDRMAGEIARDTDTRGTVDRLRKHGF